MCRRLRFLLLILCLLLSGWAAAADKLAVVINGISGDPLENVKTSLDNQKKQIILPMTRIGVRNFYHKAPREITEALQPYGYFSPKITRSLTKTGNQWTATFTISLGRPVIIEQTDINILGPGRHDDAFEKLKQRLKINPGEVLNTDEYEKAKQFLYDLAATRGYFNGKIIENKIYINLVTYKARIVIDFDTGRRYLFGKTLFSDTPFSPKFLNRFLRYQKGEPYEYAKIERTQQDFIDSNYFSVAIIKPVIKDKGAHSVPIKVQLTPRKRYAIALGLGYGTDTGIRATAGFDVRRVNRYGHQFKSLIQASEQNSFVSASYLIPGRHPASDVWAFTTGYADFNQPTGKGTSFKAEASYTTSFNKWRQTAALTFVNEHYTIVNLPTTDATLLYPNLSWSYLSTHDKLHPKNGFSFNGTLGGSPEFGLSKAGFIQARVDTRFLMTFFNSTRILLSASLGRTEINQINNLPFSLQFFAGGARSIRGYNFNQIGPGKNLFVGSVEVQQRIKGDFYLVGFFDAGNVTNDSPFSSLYEGVGPGIAWLSPVGIFEITVANAITLPNRPWLIQFTMGPSL